MRGVSFGDKFFNRGFLVFGVFEHVGKLGEHVGYSGVYHYVGACDVESRAERTEFELVAGKRKRRRTVAVGGVRHKFGNGFHNLHFVALFALILRPALHGVEYVRKLRAEEHGYYCGRSFVCAQAVVVARARHA